MNEQIVKPALGTVLFRYFVRLQNPFMIWLLGSPLHAVVSQKYLLITVTGRKTGRQYTMPIQYAAVDNQLFVITSREYQWWRNLRGGAVVMLLERGKTVEGWAIIEQEATAIAQIARRIYPRLRESQFARFLPSSVAVTITVRGNN
jgi:hypothetical protein